MKIQDILLSMGKEGCLLLDYCKLAGITLSDLITNFNSLVDSKIIREDCYVKDADKLMKYFNKPYKVRKIDISDVLPGQQYIAIWENGGNGHFVIMQGDRVIFNTLETSYCVNYGKMNPTVRVLCSL